jgi:hypothetical protein
VEVISGYCAHNVERPEYSIHEWFLDLMRVADRPHGQPARLLSGQPGNMLFGKAPPLREVCEFVRSDASELMEPTDRRWFEWKCDVVAPLVPVSGGPAVAEQAAVAPRKRRAPRIVDLSVPPVLSQGVRRGARQQRDAKPDGADNDDNDAAAAESSSDDGDGDDPEYYVLRIDGLELRDGVEWYHVLWAEPYLGESDWLPVTQLSGSAHLIRQYMRTHDPNAHAHLTDINLAARDAARLTRAAAEEARVAAEVACPNCGRRCQGQRGLSSHMRHCSRPK